MVDARSLSTGERLAAALRLGGTAGYDRARCLRWRSSCPRQPELPAARAGRDARVRARAAGGAVIPAPGRISRSRVRASCTSSWIPAGTSSGEGRQALPADRILRRTIFLCAEPPPSGADDELHRLAPASRSRVRPSTSARLSRMHRLEIPARLVRPGYSKSLDRFDPNGTPADRCHVPGHAQPAANQVPEPRRACPLASQLPVADLRGHPDRGATPARLLGRPAGRCWLKQRF